MLKTRIAFFGTCGWELTNIHLERFVRRKANIVVFVSCPEEKMKSTVNKGVHKDGKKDIDTVSKSLGVPLVSAENIESDDFKIQLGRYGPDVIIVCGFPVLVPGGIINMAPFGAINFHSSLLPRHAGMHPGFWAIWYGDKISGMVVHFMDDGIDTGDIIYSSKVPVLFNDTVDSLYGRIWKSSLKLVDRLLEDLDNKNIKCKPQKFTHSIYNYDITEKDFELDFRQPAEILAGRINMLPGKFYFILNNEKNYVNSCRVIDEPAKRRKFKINTPYLINDDIFFVTPRKFLVIEEINKNGKLIIPAKLL